MDFSSPGEAIIISFYDNAHKNSYLLYTFLLICKNTV